MSTLTDRLASNIDRLEADAAAIVADSDAVPMLVQAIGQAGLVQVISQSELGASDTDCWYAGYYMGLMRALEVLKDYDEEVV